MNQTSYLYLPTSPSDDGPNGQRRAAMATAMSLVKLRLRLFFMWYTQLFGYDEGREWFVSHYLFEQRP